MGLSSLRRHRGDYGDPKTTPREPTRGELEAQVAELRAKNAQLEAALAAATPPTKPSEKAVETSVETSAIESEMAPALVPDAPARRRGR